MVKKFELRWFRRLFSSMRAEHCGKEGSKVNPDEDLDSQVFPLSRPFWGCGFMRTASGRNACSLTLTSPWARRRHLAFHQEKLNCLTPLSIPLAWSSSWKDNWHIWWVKSGRGWHPRAFLNIGWGHCIEAWKPAPGICSGRRGLEIV